VGHRICERLRLFSQVLYIIGLTAPVICATHLHSRHLCWVLCISRSGIINVRSFLLYTVFFSFNFKAYNLTARKTVYVIKLEGNQLWIYLQGIRIITALITFMGHHLPFVRSQPFPSCSEDGSNRFLWNECAFLPANMESQSRGHLQETLYLIVLLNFLLASFFQFWQKALNPFQSNFSATRILTSSYLFWAGRGWWITCNYPTVLKEKNINRNITTCAICWLKSVLHEEKRRNRKIIMSVEVRHRIGKG
jgi:hypothetical protein